MNLNTGHFRIDIVPETIDVPFAFAEFLPNSTPEQLAAEAHWLRPHYASADLVHGLLSFHSYLLRSPTQTVLIDACMGNDKERGGHPLFHRLQTPWLSRLAALGVQPEDVDYVLCTHLHGDHVGWNTCLRDGRWVPTFPRARYVFSKVEYEHRRAAFEADPSAGFGIFADSILPVMSSGQALLVDSDFELGGLLRLESAAGHTPGNVIVHLDHSSAANISPVIFSGDVVHHPVQVKYPEWSSAFCEDPRASAYYRQAFVERYADSECWILPAHFPRPSAGQIIRAGGVFHWHAPSESPAR